MHMYLYDMQEKKYRETLKKMAYAYFHKDDMQANRLCILLQRYGDIA